MLSRDKELLKEALNNNKELDSLRKAAKTGDDVAMFKLGYANQFGQGIPIDISSAAYWYLDSARKNSTHQGGSRRAIIQLTELAAAVPPNVTVLNCLAACYESGYGVSQHQESAMNLYRLAAKLGDDVAMCNIGLAYQYGSQPNINIAALWYLESARKNTENTHGSLRAIKQLEALAKEVAPNIAVLTNLAACYQLGYGVTRNLERAVALYRQAAELGDDVAMCELGKIYQLVLGPSITQAAEWYLKSAEKNTRNPVGSSFAVQRLIELANEEFPNATVLNNLGVCYMSGYDVDKDQQKAQELFYRAEEMGNDAAMCNLGLMFLSERNKGVNEITAVRWLLKSAQQRTENPNGSQKAIQQLKDLQKAIRSSLKDRIVAELCLIALEQNNVPEVLKFEPRYLTPEQNFGIGFYIYSYYKDQFEILDKLLNSSLDRLHDREYRQNNLFKIAHEHFKMAAKQGSYDGQRFAMHLESSSTGQTLEKSVGESKKEAYQQYSVYHFDQSLRQSFFNKGKVVETAEVLPVIPERINQIVKGYLS